MGFFFEVFLSRFSRFLFFLTLLNVENIGILGVVLFFCGALGLNLRYLYVATWGKRLRRAQHPAINPKEEAKQIQRFQVDANILKGCKMLTCS